MPTMQVRMSLGETLNFIGGWIKSRVFMLFRTAPAESPVWWVGVIALGVILLALYNLGITR